MAIAFARVWTSLLFGPRPGVPVPCEACGQLVAADGWLLAPAAHDCKEVCC